MYIIKIRFYLVKPRLALNGAYVVEGDGAVSLSLLLCPGYRN